MAYTSEHCYRVVVTVQMALAMPLSEFLGSVDTPAKDREFLVFVENFLAHAKVGTCYVIASL